MFEKEKEILIKNLEQENYITSDKVKKAFEQVPREVFVPQLKQDYAYSDSPLSIGNGQTISAPHMIAIMIEELNLEEDMNVLEVGTGSGYHAALVSKIVKDSGHVYSIERFETLANQARKNLNQAGINNVTVKVGDGSKGIPDYKPFDRIYVTCTAPQIPHPLKNQLDDPGILLIPIGNVYGQLVKLVKRDGWVDSQNILTCAFVPLIGKYGH